MNITVTDTFKKQLFDVLDTIEKVEGLAAAKSFKLYLDTILLNMPTKVAKYKNTELLESDEVQEIDFKTHKIFFLYEEQKDTYVILGII